MKLLQHMRDLLVALAIVSLPACLPIGMDGSPRASSTPAASHRSIRGVLLTQGSFCQAAQVSAPTAGTVLAQQQVASGFYQVDVLVQQTGTVDAATPTNVKLQNGPNGGPFKNDGTMLSIGSQTASSFRIQCADQDFIQLIAVANAAGGSLYNVQMNIKLVTTAL